MFFVIFGKLLFAGLGNQKINHLIVPGGKDAIRRFAESVIADVREILVCRNRTCYKFFIIFFEPLCEHFIQHPEAIETTSLEFHVGGSGPTGYEKAEEY